MNKHALITGGTSGLGLSMAKKLANEGYEITIVGRDKEKLAKAKITLEKYNLNINTFVGDISKASDLQLIANQLREKNITIDFLILNAGIVHVGALLDTDNIEALKEVIDIDLWGTMLSAKYFVPLMLPSSKVLIISSALGLFGAAGYSAYCAAKAGVINFAAVMRRELLHKNIQVQIACPGDIDTPQYEDEFRQMPAWMDPEKQKKTRKLRSSDVVANEILNKCSRNKKIIVSGQIRMIALLQKFLPKSAFDLILDYAMPIPNN